jgi:hypothetical protein
MHRMNEQKDDLYDVFIYCMKFLKYDLYWDWIKGICHVQLKNNPIEVKVQGALNVVDYYFIIAFNCNLKLVWGRNVLQKCYGIESLKCGLWVNIMFFALQWDELQLQALSW